MYESSPDLHASVDAQSGRIVDCNETLARELGYAKSELIGLPIESLYEGDPALAASGEVHDAELVLARKDGTTLDVSLNASSLRDAQGRVIQTRLVWRDIHARKQTDRDRRFLLEFSDLLRNAAGAQEATARVTERLAHHLRASRCMFVEVRRPARLSDRAPRSRRRDVDQGQLLVRPVRPARHRGAAQRCTGVNHDTSRNRYTAKYYERSFSHSTCARSSRCRCASRGSSSRSSP